MIVPMLCVGMQPGTLRVPSKAERRAREEAFPRRAWERSSGEVQQQGAPSPDKLAKIPGPK